MKKFLVIGLLLLSACTLPGPVATPTPAPIPSLAPTAVTAVALEPTTEPGTEANPLIMAMAPSAYPTEEQIQAANGLAARLQSLTGYSIVIGAPTSEQELLRALQAGNAHFGVLSPFGYLLTRQEGDASALLSRTRDGQASYGAQFIARPDEGFKSFYDTDRQENTAEAGEALKQFRNRKPCWSDAASPSGYVVPLGYLREADVPLRDPAFVEGQPTVVRAVYGKGICDFGATYVDARRLPALEADYPDVLEKVAVIWQIPAIIPYESIVTSTRVNPEIKRSLLRAFIDIMGTPDGRLLIQTVYGIDAFQPANDALYDDFAHYVEESGLDLNALIK